MDKMNSMRCCCDQPNVTPATTLAFHQANFVRNIPPPPKDFDDDEQETLNLESSGWI